MIIDVSQILNSRGLSKKIDESLCFDDVSFNGNDISFVLPIKVIGNIKNDNGVLVLNLKASTKFRTVCGRCLCDFDVEFSFDVDEKFVKNSADEETVEIIDNSIDLSDVVLKHFFMSLPISFICKPDCKGLCQKCGHNLNEGDCNCCDDDIDPRMSALLKFKK